jgi:hypothetical protein
MASTDSSDLRNSPEVVSPFAHAQTAVGGEQKSKRKSVLWISLAIAVVVLIVGSVATVKYLGDPYRTLEAFPVAKYFEGYRGLMGSRFKSDLRVEADLGYKDGVGRLMVFSTPADSRAIVVLMPPKLASIYFTKGQSYVAELEVREGGLIYANSCRKN